VPAGDAIGEIAALAFHVDYRDRLVWKDRFAQSAFTARQYDAMRANGSGLVYTPQVLLQGRDFAAWRDARLGATVAAIPARRRAERASKRSWRAESPAGGSRLRHPGTRRIS
jgi:hypothetical protein